VSKTLISELEKALEGASSTGLDRALATIERMHQHSVARMEALAVESIARFERMAEQDRAWASSVLERQMNVRLAVENPRALQQLVATLQRAGAVGAAGAPPPFTKASTDAAVPHGAGADEEARELSKEEVATRAGAHTLASTEGFAGYTPPTTR
jgi:hypothetical protein